MARQKATNPAADLKQPPVDKVLLIRNVRDGGAISITSGGRGDQAEPDISLERWGEKVVPASWAKTSRDLRAMVEKGWLETEWVDETYQVRHIPNPSEAPSDILANLTPEEQRFALDSIVLQADEGLALAAVRTQVHQPEPRDRMVDTKFMLEKFKYVLDLAGWLEERWNNRSAILEAIKEAKLKIREL